MAIRSVFAFLLLMARVASAQGTTTFFSNIGQASGGNASIGSDSWLAGFFQTGTNSSGYLLNSIQLGLANSTGSPSGLTVMLYANRNPSGFIPGSSLATFMGSLNPSTSGTYTYTLPEPLMLSSMTPYYIVVTANTPIASGAYQWSYSVENNYNPDDGWGAGGYGQSGDGSTWTHPPSEDLEFAIIGSLAPEPRVLALFLVGGVGLMGWRKVRGVRRGA